LRRRNLPLKLLWWSVFQVLSGYATYRLRGKQFVTAKQVYGLLESGAMTEDFWLGLLPQLTASTNEIYCHPEDPQLAVGSANKQGGEELAALLSPAVKQLLQAHNIQLATYADLHNCKLTDC
jgi:hypothetical protein